MSETRFIFTIHAITVGLVLFSASPPVKAEELVLTVEVGGWFNEDAASVPMLVDKAGCTLTRSGSGILQGATKGYPQNGLTTVLSCPRGRRWTHRGVALQLLAAPDGRSFLALGYMCPSVCTQLYSVERHLLRGTILNDSISVSDLGTTTLESIGRLPSMEILALSTGSGGFVLRNDGGKCGFRVVSLRTTERPPTADISFNAGTPDCHGLDASAFAKAVLLPTWP